MLKLVKRELLVAYRRRADLLNSLWFFLLLAILFVLALGPSPKLLSMIAPTVIWVGALLAVVISLERLFRDDFLDGSLEQLLLMPQPLALLVLAKVLAHWLVTGLPLLLISPLLGFLLTMDWDIYSTLWLTLLLGTPTLTFLGAIGSALTVCLGQAVVLVSLLVLPLFVPVLIFATAGIENAANGLPINAPLAMLGAFLVSSVSFAPIAIAASLRMSLQ
ncbi:MAG: heme exporter protein CcmB [Vibrionaceae bacterium]